MEVQSDGTALRGRNFVRQLLVCAQILVKHSAGEQLGAAVTQG